MIATPEPATPTTAEHLLGELVAARLLEDGRASSVWAEFLAQTSAEAEEADALLEFLLQSGLLSPFQAERIRNRELDKLQLGPFLLLEPVRSASLGTLYRALRRSDRQRFAIRVLPLRSVWRVHNAKRVRDSFATIASHPTLVPFVDIDTADGFHYLAWPWVEGESLESLVARNGALSPLEAARIFSDLAEGLNLCHAEGLPHGCLQPSNILINSEGKPRLLEMGLGAILAENLSEGQSMVDTLSLSSSTAGMLDYCAPECILDPTARTTAGDAYSFGCSLYFALTASPPFPDPRAVQKIIGHQTQDALPVRNRNPKIPAALATIVENLLKKAPELRPASLGNVRQELRSAVALPNFSQEEFEAPPPSLGLNRIVQALSDTSSGQSDAVNFTLTKRSENPDDSDAVSFDSHPEILHTSDDYNWKKRPPEAFDTPTRSAISTPPPIVPVPPAVSAPPSSIRLPAHSLRSPVAEVPVRPMPTAPKQNRTIPVPVNLDSGPPSTAVPKLPPVIVPPAPRFSRKAVQAVRKALFWKRPVDAVQISIFGPPRINAGQKAQLVVYAHVPEAFDGISTLCRALNRDSELLGSGFVDVPVDRGADLGLHLALANAGVAKSLVNFPWEGQTQPRTFEIFAPWESPPGLTSGVVSVGMNEARVGAIPLHFLLLPRSS